MVLVGSESIFQRLVGPSSYLPFGGGVMTKTVRTTLAPVAAVRTAIASR